MKKQQLNSQKLKLSLTEFVWYGFNLIVGISFVSFFAVAANSKSINGDGMGLHVIWVWILDGLFAGICAMAFAKMAKGHDSGANGAAYVYTRSTFGRTTGLLVGFMQYIYLPFLLMNSIMTTIRINFSPSSLSGSAPYQIYFGSFTDLGLDMLSILLFILCVFFVMKGVTWYKRAASGTALVKWIAFCALLLLAVFLSCNHGNGGKNLEGWSDDSQVTLQGITKTFNSCFYAFLGFEMFATAGKNVKNAQKNVSRGILLAVLMAIIVYLTLSVLFFAAISPSIGFAENFNSQLWFNSNIKGFPIGISWAGFSITIVSVICMRLYAFMQKAMYGGTTLQPLAYEGFFPDKFGILDKQAIPTNANKLNVIIVLMVCTIWLVIPDIIKGSALTLHHGIYPDIKNSEVLADFRKPIFNVQALSSFTSIIAIFLYVMVILAVLTLGVQKKMKLNIAEYAMYSIAVAFLGFIAFYHYYNLIENVINDPTNTNAITGLVIEMFTTVAAISFFYIWRKVYYQRKIHVRTVSQQRKLDEPFRLLTAEEQASFIRNNE